MGASLLEWSGAQLRWVLLKWFWYSSIGMECTVPQPGWSVAQLGWSVCVAQLEWSVAQLGWNVDQMGWSIEWFPLSIHDFPLYWLLVIP